MNIPKTSPAGDESSSAQIRLACKCAMTAAATLAAVGAVIFAATPAALAVPTATNNDTSYAADEHAPKPSPPGPAVNHSDHRDHPGWCYDWPSCDPWPQQGE
jgi:hypothetical protein